MLMNKNVLNYDYFFITPGFCDGILGNLFPFKLFNCLIFSDHILALLTLLLKSRGLIYKMLHRNHPTFDLK